MHRIYSDLIIIIITTQKLSSTESKILCLLISSFPLAGNQSFPYTKIMQDLKTIVELSHQFGTPEYVKGGGGNTSYKDDSTLWVKPSGTTLAGLQEDTFVTLNRAKVNGLYDVETPEEPHAREELVKNFMGEGRPQRCRAPIGGSATCTTSLKPSLWCTRTLCW